MEKLCRGKRASESQKEYLLNYLEIHTDIANEKFTTADGAKFKEQKWRELAEELNALGGTQKDGAKWKKYWRDLRLNTRSKYCELKRQAERTGINGFHTTSKDLSAVEEKIIKIITTEAVDGDEVREMGLHDMSIESTALEADREGEREANPVSARSSRPRARKRKDDTMATAWQDSMTQLLELKQQKLELMKSQTVAVERQTQAIEAQTQVLKELITKFA